METAVEAMEVYAHFCAASGIAPERRPRRRDERDPRRQQRRRSCSRACASATGLPVRVLSAEEEAHYGYLAAVNSTTLRDGAVLDLGGGSLQLVRVRERRELATAPRGRSAPCA